ncbi:MAG TPA: hypothetical protein PKE04_12840 [Clostridia bacterium]|nr:hypothetical protein [Clostridia bacterium]
MPWFAALLGLGAGLFQARLWPHILGAEAFKRLGLIALKLLVWLLPVAVLAWRNPLAATLYVGVAGLTMTGFVLFQRRE